MTASHAKENNRSKCLIVIPAFNEEKNIQFVLEGLIRHCPELDIVVINDGSTDKTGEIAKKRGIKVISHCSNMGYGAAVQTGLKSGLNGGYDFVVLFDADGQHRPEEIDKLLRSVQKGECDVAIGSRFINNRGYIPSIPRRLGIRLFSVILRALSGTRINDVTSGFQTLNRRAFEFLAEEYPTNFPDADILLLLLLNRFRLKEIDVNMDTRMYGESTITPLMTLYYPFRVFLAIVVAYLHFFIHGKK